MGNFVSPFADNGDTIQQHSVVSSRRIEMSPRRAWDRDKGTLIAAFGSSEGAAIQGANF
jgi:hypothetical protein